MRRSICISEPNTVLAGSYGNWRFIYVTSTNIPAKTILRFDMLSNGENGEWQLPKTNPKAIDNIIWMELPNGKKIYAKEVSVNDFTNFDFILPEQIKQGEKLTITIGACNTEDNKKSGNQAQSFIQRRRKFNLGIDVKGKNEFKDEEVFSLDVKGNKLNKIRIITPSIVCKNTRFDVTLRFEDEYGNLTSNADEDTLIELTYDQLRENLKWKLFIPETGFLVLPNLYFNEDGIYRIKLQNLTTKEEFVSSPIKCFLNQEDQIFWGLLHGDCNRFNSTKDIESTLRYFRDNHSFQFFATSPEESQDETSTDDWKLISNQVAQFNEEERFVTMLGFQWIGEPSIEGIRHFVYAKDNKQLLRKKDLKSNSLKKIYKNASSKEFISIPCLTMAKEFSYNFEDYNPNFERVVEIYNAYGSSECLGKQGNPKPIKFSHKKGTSECQEGSIQKALQNGCRFGFVAGGLDRRGIYKTALENKEDLYAQGLTAILATEYSRDAIFQALYNRRCYASTGARIIISFNIAGMPLGSELNTKAKPGLVFNRHIHGFVAGTDEISEIKIYKNNKVYKSFKDENNYFEFTIDDDELLDKCTIQLANDTLPFVYYYLRVVQKDGHIAWSSPIWIDLIQEEKKKYIKK